MTKVVLAALAATVLGLFALTGLRRALPATVDQSLSALRAVDKGGQGNAEAQRAMRTLSAAGSADLLKFLNALDQASPLAENWIRNAFETVADRELRQKHALPAAELEKFVKDSSHHPRARRLAYEWLVKIDPSVTNRLIPGMLLDPAVELRRDAVAMRIAEAEKIDSAKDKEKAIRLYREALSGATQDDQVKKIVEALGKLGQKVDIAQHFAFITHFSIIGPFDHHRGVGFNAVYPPEKEIRLNAQYDGQLGKVSWQPIDTSQEYGTVDIARQIKPYKGAVMYAMAEYQSPREAPLELRLATQNAWKIWLNGEFVFARDEYHRGSTLDQYRLPVMMRAGKNTILLKICQNEQNESWAQSYQFQLRVCDSSGRGVRSQAISVSGGRH